MCKTHNLGSINSGSTNQLKNEVIGGRFTAQTPAVIVFAA